MSFSAFASSANVSSSASTSLPRQAQGANAIVHDSSVSNGVLSAVDNPQSSGLETNEAAGWTSIPLQTGTMQPFKRISVENTFISAQAGGSSLGQSSLSSPISTGSQIIQVGPGFGGLSEQSSGNSALPDVQVAAGPTNIFEMVNTEGRIWTGQGILLSTFSLSEFFQTGGDTISQPRVLYDNQSGTWFASVLDESANEIVIASSVNSDPVETWNLFKLSAGTNCPENPLIGVDGVDIVITANDYSSPGCLDTSGNYVGAQYWIIQKSSLVTGSTANFQYSSPDPEEFAVVPVDSLSYSSTLYMVSDGVGNGTSTLSFFSVTGTVPSSTVQVSNYTVGMISTPPEAIQEGTSARIDTTDARIQDAVWFQGNLWLALNDACTPAGDTQLRSCIRLIEINTISNSVIQDFDYGTSGYYYYYPALSIDESGDLGLVLGFSSLTAYPSVAITARAVTDPVNTLRSPVTLKAGAYPDYGGLFGSYFGAAIDPSNPVNFWVAGEFYPNSDWSTFVGSFKIVAAFSATFTETGLPAGSAWTLDFNSSTFNSNSNEIVVANLTSGVYTWSVTTALVSGSTGVRYLVTQSSGSLEVTADVFQSITFGTQYQVGVISSQTGLGTTTPSNSSWYGAGTVLSIGAVPASPNLFAFWSVSSSSLSISNLHSANTTVTIDGPGSIIANFAPIVVSLAPYAGEVSQGSSLSVAAIVAGANQQGAIDVYGMPSNVNYSISSTELEITPTGTLVNLTLSPLFAATPGSFAVTFLAVGNNSQSLPTIYNLTIRPAVALNISYSIQGGGSGYNTPDLNFVYNGTRETASLSSTMVTYHVDQGSAWSVSSVLNGTSPGQRWATNSTSTNKIATSGSSAAFVYYHQYLIGFSYSVQGGGYSYSSPMVNTTQLGTTVLLPLKSPVWIDSGTIWSVSNPLVGSTATERWETASTTSGLAQSPASYSFVYFRQFNSTFDYKVTGGTVSAPKVNYTSFGVTSTVAANSSVWVDWAGSYALPSVLPGSSSLVRALASISSQVAGKVFSSTRIVVQYQTQFYLGLTSVASGSGSESPASGWYPSGSSISIAETNHSGWASDGWMGTGSGSYTGSDPAFTITLSSPLNETALYSPLYFVVVTKGGSVSFSYGTIYGTIPGNSSQDIYVPLGSSLEMTATPSSILYVFKGWTGSASKSTPQLRVSASVPVALQAEFGYNYMFFAAAGVVIAALFLIVIFRRRIFR